MALRELVFICMLYGCVCAAIDAEDAARKALAPEQEDNDLKTAASGTYYGAYSNYPGGNYGYGVSGYGLLDDKYYGGGGYDNSLGYGGGGVGGYGGGYGGGVGGSGYPGYTGYSGGYGGYNKGYGGGYGGYGGYGGNGGLNSYYGYNNPSYQGANHLGYGYYGKRTGYGNIYNNGVTPSLVTGYRGYSRR